MSYPLVTAPAVIIYSIADAKAALAAAVDLNTPLTLWVPRDIAAGCGANVIAQMLARARASYPQADVLAAVDCHDAPGLALALLRRGVDRVRLTGPGPMLARVAAIAARTGAELAPAPTDALDLLGVDDPKKACESWLGRFTSRSILPHRSKGDIVD